MNSLRICFCVFLTVGWAWSLPSGMDSQSVGHNTIQAKEDLLDGIYSECINKGSVSCIKYKLFAYVDKALNKDEINLTEGVTVVRTSGSPGDGAPRSLEDNEQPKDVDAQVVSRVQRFLNEHSIKVDIKGADIVNAVSRAGKSVSDAVSQFVGDEDDVDTEESRGHQKKKKKGHSKHMVPLLMLLKFKLMGLLPFILGKIALIAGKALLLGKIALVLSLIVVLQKILSTHHEKKTVTYEVVPQPHHEHGHDSYSSGSGADLSSGGYGGGSSGGGWGRSIEAQKLAYSAQAPQTAQ